MYGYTAKYSCVVWLCEGFVSRARSLGGWLLQLPISKQSLHLLQLAQEHLMSSLCMPMAHQYLHPAHRRLGRREMSAMAGHFKQSVGQACVVCRPGLDLVVLKPIVASLVVVVLITR